jgi:hypothetical protein
MVSNRRTCGFFRWLLRPTLNSRARSNSGCIRPLTRSRVSRAGWNLDSPMWGSKNRTFP